MRPWGEGFLIFGIVALCIIPAVIEVALRGWASIVEAYWKMRVRIREAPAAAEKEYREES